MADVAVPRPFLKEVGSIQRDRNATAKTSATNAVLEFRRFMIVGIASRFIHLDGMNKWKGCVSLIPAKGNPI